MQWIWLAGLLAFILPLSNSEARSYAVPKTVIDWTGDPAALIEQYNKTLESWSKSSCPPKLRREFQDLYRRYRAAGFYIPVIGTDEVHVEAIQENLPRIEKKLKWIQKLKKDLHGSKLPNFTQIATPLEKRVDELLEFKKKYHLAKDEKLKAKLARESARALKKLNKEFRAFAGKIPFLLSFDFPVDHLSHRMSYEKLKAAGDERGATALFFKRQILEDGALDPDHTRSDLYLRTSLDTIALNLASAGQFLAEEPRYDLEWVLKLVKSNLARGKRVQLNRLSEWEARIRNELGFYRELISEQGKEKTQNLVATKAKATSELRDFVYRKHAETYEFFNKQPEIIQALFAFDQILLNEVGQATSENFRDRRDIAQIIINRRYNTHYSKLEKGESLYKYLHKHTSLKEKEIALAKWLNVMFKEEQFSFTLYFIPAVEMVFCPDFYKTARSSRGKNLGLALDMLKKPRTDFRALRYFSRFSMVGKIDMAQMWDGYVPLPPAPGRPVRLTSKLRQTLKKQLYRYLYNFIGSDGETYHVLEIGKRSYVVKSLKSNPKLFNYRDPHQFTYFEAKPE